MKMLQDVILKADEEKTALGHFNISTIDALWGIFEAARSLDVPIIIGTSEGERKFIGARQAVALIKSIRSEFDYPIYLNADHTYTFEGVKEAVDLGYDAVIFDGAKLSIEENIKITSQCVDYAKSVNSEIVVEAELGYIGTSSKLLDKVPDDVTEGAMTTVEQAKEFVKATGVDLLAPSVGNLHGMLKHSKNPRLDIERIRAIREAAEVPLVLHGGSGITDEDFTKAIEAGIGIVHINTEIRKAWRDATDTFLKENPETVAPYKILSPARSAVEESVKRRLKLFSRIGV